VIRTRSATASVAVLAYLAAALLPCEPPAEWIARSTSGAAHAVPAATPSLAAGDAASPAPGALGGRGHAGHAPPHARVDSVPRADATPGARAHAGHAPPHARADSGPRPGTAPGSRAPAHVDPDAHAVPDARAASARGLAFVPTCLCGCGSSRALVGGAAARLGPTVPSATFAGLLPVDRAPVPSALPLPADDLHPPIDPIPI
jgi:hypothetical protein